MDPGAGKGVLRGTWATCGAGDPSIRIRVRVRKKDSRVRTGVVHVKMKEFSDIIFCKGHVYATKHLWSICIINRESVASPM